MILTHVVQEVVVWPNFFFNCFLIILEVVHENKKCKEIRLFPQKSFQPIVSTFCSACSVATYYCSFIQGYPIHQLTTSYFMYYDVHTSKCSKPHFWEQSKQTEDYAI